MMDVIIRRGTYGHRIGKNRVKSVSVGEKITVSDDEADRLVQMGIASYADAHAVANGAAKTSPNGSDAAGSENLESDASDDETELSKLEKMPKADLERMAKDMGVDISGAKNNHERAALILAADTESGEDTSDLTGDIVR